MPRAAIVIPCFNEAARLDVARLRGELARSPEVDYVLVDDGSRDETRARLEEVRRGLEARVEVLGLDTNQGKAEAVRLGLLAALARRPDYVGYWDADLATPIEVAEDFRRWLDVHADFEILTGARVALLGRHVDRKPLRHYVGRVFATAASLTLGLPIYDTQCGAKLFRVLPHTKELFAEPFVGRWVFDIEILARRQRLARERGLARVEAVLYEFVLTRWIDVAGSKVKPLDLLRSLWQLRAIRKRYFRER
ncbi:MAG: glycosyltransferase [Planctomycetes bacterium]|nr:glycosyltransferase [Planctomycetota bacterium]